MSTNTNKNVNDIEYIDSYTDVDIDIIHNYSDYEIINESKCIPIKNRYRKQTWKEYFRKLYTVTIILLISISIYVYYSYTRKQHDIISKL